MTTRTSLRMLGVLAAGAALTGSGALAQNTGPVYQVRPPAGKLPLPQHDPSFTRAQYDSMMQRLFIINNYALYQGGDATTKTYLHDGLDDILPNGTKIYAVASGTVRQVDNRIPNYKNIIIEDDAHPGDAWSYTHVDSFQVKIGDHVPQGTYIAQIKFRGLEHTHLDRVHKPAGAEWTKWSTLPHSNPYPFFDLKDTEPPVIDTPFAYFHNESDSAFARPVTGPTVVSGDVDIVVGMRDRASFSRPPGTDTTKPFWGDRLAVTRVEYEIARAGAKGPPERHRSFDFGTMEVMPITQDTAAGQPTSWQVTLTIYKFVPMMRPGERWGQQSPSFYTVTNVPEGGSVRVTPADGANAWHTAAMLPNGKPKYPNGDYVITVRAWDAAGNLTTKSDTVTVRN